MPSSSLGLIPIVVRMVQALNPCSVLDIGFGMGKYGLLCREYLELWGPEKCKRFGQWRTRIDGIEACGDYVGDLQRAIYDRVFIGDAVDVLRGLDDQAYDLGLLVEIIEHLDRERGEELLRQALRVCRVLIVTTPKRFKPQSEELGNPYEVHRSSWTAADLKRFGHVWVWPHRRELIAVVGRRREDLAPVVRARPLTRFLARQARKLRDALRRRGGAGCG